MRAMDRLQAMVALRRVVELKSFSAAARDQRVTSAAITKQIAALERHLHTRLLNRTTRRVSPTPAGAAYYQECCRILDDLAEVEGTLSGAATRARGTLRVSAPMSFGLLHVMPHLPELLARHPELHLDVSLADRFVDVVEDRADVIIRVTDRLHDSDTLVARKLARTGSLLCASPKYLRARGEPKTPQDLAQHDCLVYSLGRAPGEWTFTGPNGRERVRVSGRLAVNNSLALRDATVAGAGIALLPAFYVQAELRAKKLRQVLGDHAPPPLFVYGLYQRSPHVPFKVRALLDFLGDRFASASWATRESS